MTPGSVLHDGERKELLHQLQQLASDADATADRIRTFLPLRWYTQALQPRTMLVRGERGAGKTALFSFLRALKVKGVSFRHVFPGIAHEDLLWIEGFSENGREHPLAAVVDQLGVQSSDDEIRTFWIAHLAGRVSHEAPQRGSLPEPFGHLWREDPTSPERWLGAATASLSSIVRWLDTVDADISSRGETISVTYDHLDKLGQNDSALRDRFVTSLLATWLSLSNRYERLRPKIFLREDLYERAKRTPDASKLETRSVQLLWTREDLFRVFLRHLSDSAGLRQFLFSSQTPIEFHEDPDLGWLPPEALPEEGLVSQKSLCTSLVDVVMGAGTKKGYTHRWIPNHIQDARGAIVPRSIINLFAFAADWALAKSPRASGTRLLTPQELHAGLEKTSQYRVEELKEEHYVVDRLEGLRDLIVMAPRKEVVARLSRATGANRDGFGSDGERALEELVRLGVLSIRDDGRIDAPDLYRYGYGIKRKGGVARPK